MVFLDDDDAHALIRLLDDGDALWLEYLDALILNKIVSELLECSLLSPFGEPCGFVIRYLTLNS